MDNNKSNENSMKKLTDEKSEIGNIELLGKDIDKLKWYSVTDFAKWIKAATRQKGEEAIPHGNIHIKEYKSYYDTNNTITTALATNPSNPEHSAYNVESIFQHNRRNAEKVYVSNDGSDTLFVLVSHGGVEHSTRERPIYPGDVKTYYNVFELRLRSPTAGVPYRISEYEIDTGTGSSGSARGNPSRTSINIATAGNNTIIAAPGVGKRIRIVNIFFICTGAVTVQLFSDGNALTGIMSFAANSGMGFNGDFNPLQMNTNEAFIINLGGNVQVSGFVLYYSE